MVVESWHAWTEHRSVSVPEVLITSIIVGHTYEALRGYAHTLAVFADGVCIGWIKKETLDA